MEFDTLMPELIIGAASEQGYQPTGVFYPLNSYENRVYEIGIEGGEPLIAKFYRPGRWTLESIAEEHRFLQTLLEEEIPVVASLPLKKSTELSPYVSQIEDIYYALFPKFRGRQESELSPEALAQLGRTLARLHNVGEHFSAPSRMALNPETFGRQSQEVILQLGFLPHDLRPNLESILTQVIQLCETAFQPGYKNILLHGDCHPGNILWNAEGPHLLDFDDMIMAPTVQDLWMLFFGTAEEQGQQKDTFFEAYEMFRPFQETHFQLAEALRSLRMIRHSAWVGQRFSENIFQRAFPYFSERRYWEEFLLSMKEQVALLQGSF